MPHVFVVEILEYGGHDEPHGNGREDGTTHQLERGAGGKNRDGHIHNSRQKNADDQHAVSCKVTEVKDVG